MKAVRVGVIGYGYWGPNLARVFQDLPGTELAAICDVRSDQLLRAESKYRGVALTQDFHALFNMELDAVAIATPPKTHYAIAAECLENNLHLLIEKPITLSSTDAEDLMSRAHKRERILMVGHTFEYNLAVHAMKDMIDRKELGELYYLDTARLNLGLFQRDSNVLWDLAPHDISILLYLLGETPLAVSAKGLPCVTPGIYDVAYITLFFPRNLAAYVHVSWLDPCKVRRVTVVGSKKMAVYNDMETEGKIKIYDKGIEPPAYTNGFGEFQYNYRTGDITIPRIPYVEPLTQECLHFVECIVSHTPPLSGGEAGLRVVKIIEAAQRSISRNSDQEMIQW